MVEMLWRTLSWFLLVWFASMGVVVALLQALLPRAWQAIHNQPPRGPVWAYRLWYQRSQVYATGIALTMGLGLLAAAIFWVTQA